MANPNIDNKNRENNTTDSTYSKRLSQDDVERQNDATKRNAFVAVLVIGAAIVGYLYLTDNSTAPVVTTAPVENSMQQTPIAATPETTTTTTPNSATTDTNTTNNMQDNTSTNAIDSTNNKGDAMTPSTE